MQPWRLLENSKRYIDGWLVGYSGGMGAIAAVLIVDYWLARRKRLELGDLYRAQRKLYIFRWLEHAGRHRYIAGLSVGVERADTYSAWRVNWFLQHAL
jgi:cytosine/uracil/thiamine/allantoin permease